MTLTNSTICIYGETATYKTTNVGRFAHYIYEKHGQATRLITADLGGWNPVQSYIDAGIILPYRLSDNPNLLRDIRKLSLGWWPNEKGELTPTSDLNKTIGAYAVEGLSSISSLALRHLANKGQKVTQEVVGMFNEGDEKFAAPSMSHYGLVQQFTLDMIAAFAALPVHKVLFTAHEGKGKDPYTQQLVYGPGTAGQAITAIIPKDMGDLLHFDSVIEGGKTKVRAYFDKHPDPFTKILWPAKYRLEASQAPELFKKWPDGFMELTLDQGLDTYLRTQDELQAKALGSLTNLKTKLDSERTN